MCGRWAVSWPSFSAASLFIKGASACFALPLRARLIPGLSYVDQLNQILHYLGTPSEDTLRRVGSPRVRPLSL